MASLRNARETLTLKEFSGALGDLGSFLPLLVSVLLKRHQELNGSTTKLGKPSRQQAVPCLHFYHPSRVSSLILCIMFIPHDRMDHLYAHLPIQRLFAHPTLYLLVLDCLHATWTTYECAHQPFCMWNVNEHV